MRIVVGAQIKMGNRLFECVGWGGSENEDLLWFTEVLGGKLVGDEFQRPRQIIMDLINRKEMEVVRYIAR